MRGEKIDLESIKNTIKSDLEGFKQKATVVGGRNEKAGATVRQRNEKQIWRISEGIFHTSSPRQGIGHAIGVFFKAFFLFISVIITFALVMALIGLIFTGAGVLPLKELFYPGFLAEYYGLGCASAFPDLTGSGSANLADPPDHRREKGQ